MFDDLRGLKKRFKLNMTVTRENLFEYMWEHGYGRISTVRERVSYLLSTEETLDRRPYFMEKNDLTKGTIEQYEVIYREVYYNGEEHIIVLLGKPLHDESGDCDIIKLKCEPRASRVISSHDLDGSIWITSRETDMNNMFLNCSVPTFENNVRLWSSTDDDD
jgi:hypothetical protein